MSEEEQIELKGFGGSVKAQGKQVSGVVLIAMVVTLLVALGYKHHMANEELLQKVLDATTEMTYVLSLPQEARDKLNIAMPDSLRRKTRGRQWERGE